MRIAELIKELAKQPLGADVLIETTRGNERPMTKEDITYLGEVKHQSSSETKKTVLIKNQPADEVAKHYDVTTMQTDEGFLDVVLFPLFTQSDKALVRALELMEESPSRSDYILPTIDDVEVVFVMDNPDFEGRPSDEPAYLYSTNAEEWLPLIQVPFRTRE